MATCESPEYLTIRKHFVELQRAVTRGNVPAALFQDELITEDGLEKATNMAVGQNKRGIETMKEVLNAVRIKPALFDKFCDALKHEGGVTGEVIHALGETLKEMKKSHSEPTVTVEFQSLRDQLGAFQSAQQSTTDESIQEQTLNVAKYHIQQYIENGLRSGVEASVMKSDMENLCRVHRVLSGELRVWSTSEVDNISRKLSTVSKKQVEELVPRECQKPLLFSKDTLYHASLCCAAISGPVSSDPLSFFRNKRPQHSLTQVSFSQSRDDITPYLIARQEDVVYAAFKSNLQVSEWLGGASSFTEGLMRQCSQIPLRFFMDELLNNRRIVLTGFSFGGMLACCICARLWHNAMADQDALTQDIICITFGQPFLPIKMVEDEIEISPQFEKSIHCIFSKDDYVPLALSYLPVDKREPLPDTFHSLSKAKALVGQSDAVSSSEPVRPFQIPFVSTFLKHLAVLQEHCLESEEPKVINAQVGLRKSIDQLQGHGSATLYGTSYIMLREKKRGIVWQQPPSKELAAEVLIQPAGMLTELFIKHSMDEYISLIRRSHLDKPEKYALPKSTREVSEVSDLKPKIVEPLKYYDYPNERVVVLQGDNLWFSYKICLDEKGPNDCEFNTLTENTTQLMVEFRATLEESSDLRSTKQVKLSLYTHFASPIRQTLEIAQEPHVFSVRQMQLAKHTPSQVIQLAYLCALLEQQPQNADSKRFRAIVQFLEKAVQVVPFESVFDSITYGEHEIALTCAKILRERKPQLQLSQHMIVGASKASLRARTGYDGKVIDRCRTPFVPTYQQAILAAESVGVQATITTQLLVNPRHQQKTQPKPKHPRLSAERRKPSSQRAQSSKTYSEVAKSPLPQATQLMAMPIPFPVFLDPHVFPPCQPFPEYITRYLENCVRTLNGQIQTPEFRVITKKNISELYFSKSSAHFKSPVQILNEGLKDIRDLAESHSIKLPNEQMLAIVDSIYKKDVALCALLLGAFMEHQIRIPLIYNPKTTAETLSSKATPVAVGVWALFSQNLTTLQKKLAGNNRSQLIIDIKEYIEGIRQQLPETEDMMYAGKLQFLLQGVQQIVTASSQYISYSLERQLCSNPKFDRDWSLRHLITQWDTIFQNDALSLIGESHRPLVARWLKWTMLIHDLRETLAQYTCIGVTGLVNSGKSLLVKKIFKIEKVKVGVQTAKRTTVPLLYNLEDTIEGLDVIDFPGIDDSDHTIPELARLLLSLSQIIVFVVDFRRASTDPVKEFLRELTRNGVPIHICITHADILYTECKAEGKLSNIEEELERVQAELGLKAHHHTKAIGLYSFNHTPDVSTDELKKWSINSEVDLGNWLVHILRNRFQQEETAKKLEEFLKIR